MGKGSRAPASGLRRVQWVRIDLTGDAPRAEVAGIANRQPVVQPIPLRTAEALSAAGVPTLVRRSSESTPVDT
jgi:hypothetical protein